MKSDEVLLEKVIISDDEEWNFSGRVKKVIDEILDEEKIEPYNYRYMVKLTIMKLN